MALPASCPVCGGRSADPIDHPCGRWLCRDCVTLYAGSDREWELNRERRTKHREWVESKERDRMRPADDEGGTGDSWGERADLQ